MQFLSANSCASGKSFVLKGCLCLFVSMSHEIANFVSSAALEPTVRTLSIASAAPFLLISMTLAPPKSCCNSSDPLKPHFFLIRSGMSSSRRFISFALNDLMMARGRNERNSVPAEVGHHHHTFTCTQHSTLCSTFK